jgi:hypothetical protein
MRFILPCAYDDTCVSKIAFKRADCRVDLYIYTIDRQVMVAFSRYNDICLTIHVFKSTLNAYSYF